MDLAIEQAKKGLKNKADFKDLKNFQEASSTIQSINHKS